MMLLAVALLTTVAAIFRYTGLKQIPDWFLLVSYFQGIMIFWGIAITTHQRNHICIDILWVKLGSKGRRRLDLLADLIVVLFLALLSWALMQRVYSTAESGLVTTDLGLTVWPFFATACFGIVLAFVLSVAGIYRRNFLDPLTDVEEKS